METVDWSAPIQAEFGMPVHSVPSSTPGRSTGFSEFEFIDPETLKPTRLDAGSAGVLRLEDAPAVRNIPSCRGQRHLPGRYWFATTEQHVRYESLLERDILIVLDYVPSVIAVSAQTFRVHYSEGGRLRRNVPDLFARRADGGALVVDVKRARGVAREENASCSTLPAALAPGRAGSTR